MLVNYWLIKKYQNNHLGGDKMAIYYYTVIYAGDKYQEISSSKSEIMKAWNEDKKHYQVSEIKKRVSPVHEVFVGSY